MRRFLTLGPAGAVEVPEAEATVFYYTNLDPDELGQIGERWGIDRHDIDAALDPDEVPRVEFVGDTMSMFWKRPTSARTDQQVLFNVASMGVFIRQGRMIVVTSDDYFPLGGSQFVGARHFGSFILRMLHHSIHHYFEHLKVIKMISREMQGRIATSADNNLMLSMFRLSESLIYYLNALESDAAVLRKLQCNPEKLDFEKVDDDYLEDLMIDQEQCRKLTEIYESVLEGMVDARSGIMNNNINVLLKNLTLINLVFLPLNLLAGIGGMSEYSVMLGTIPMSVGYSLAIVGLGIFGWATWWLLSRYVDDFNRPRKRKIKLGHSL